MQTPLDLSPKSKALGISMEPEEEIDEMTLEYLELMSQILYPIPSSIDSQYCTDATTLLT